MYEKYMNNKFTNGAIMYSLSLVLCIILPPYLFFKFIYSILSCNRSGENVNDKVVLITGASSGIREYLAYEYAKKGASLAIVARRESQLLQVADRARVLGSPDVLPLLADVSNIDDCKRFVDETVNHFGRIDHLVNNAGIGSFYSIGNDITKFTPVMDINFWGSIYPSYFAIPHLKKSKGKIVVNSSSAALLSPPKSGFYGASKAALISFYESMRVELAPEIGLTIVTLGYIESEMIQGKHLSKEGVVEVITRLKDVTHLKLPRNMAVVKSFPVMSTEPCAKAIVNGVCRGERHITEPQYVRVLFLLKFLCPELIDWFFMKSFPSKKHSGKKIS